MLNERKLTKAELNKREDIIKDMKKNKRALVKKYGKDAESVMYGRATNIAKKQAESMNQDKLREMIKDALQNPKKADLNKDGKLSDYEKKRGAAIEKSMKKQDLKEFGSSDMNALLSSMHISLGYPKEFPGLSRIMDAAEEATDFYMDDFEEYKTQRDDLVMSNARAYARRQFPEFMAAAAKFIEPVDEAMDINDPVMMKMRAAKMRAANAGGDGNDKFFRKNAKRLSQLKALKDKRAQIMRDMEQEAEMEGGPIADRYGDILNKIDKAIAMLQTTEEKEYALREMSGDKMEALMELRNILDELQVLGDQARNIIANSFPSFLSKGEAYGAFDMGSSVNRYDTTLASIVDEIEEYGDEEEDEDMMQEDLDPDLKTSDGIRAQIKKYKMALASMSGKQQKAYYDAYIKPLQQKLDDMEQVKEDLDLGHQDNEPHMLKADLYRIGKYAMELYQMVDGFEGKGEVDFPHWWQSKIIKSKDALVGAKHYLDFETKEPQIDAMVDVAQEEDVIDENALGMTDPRLSSSQHSELDYAVRDDRRYTFGNDPYADDQLRYKYAKKMGFLKEEEAGEADMVASDIQKAMNAAKGDEAKTHQLKKARTAMNKGDLDKAKKIADRIAKMLKNK